MPDPRATYPLRNYALGGLALLTAVALARHLPHLAPGAFNWTESGNTAQALVEGRGFSDPFAGGTGPTAWIPPVYVWIDAAVFFVAGIKTAAAAKALLTLTVLGLAAAHAVLLACVPREAVAMRRVTSAAFLGLAIFMPAGPLEVLSEVWLHALLSVALLWAALEYRRAPRPAVTAVLVVVAAIAPLAHAGLALSTGLVLLALAAGDLRARRWRVAPYLAAAATVLAVGAWTVRNTIALGRFVPLKSNLWFELYLANVAADDGLPRAETVLETLPFFSVAQFNRYATLGEMRYVDTFKAPSLLALRGAPGHFAGNVGRRAFNALVFCRDSDGSMDTRTAFRPADVARLVQAGQLLPLGGTKLSRWTRIDTDPDEAHATLAGLGLEDFPGVWRDWAEKHAAYDEVHWSLPALLRGFMIAGLPVLALLGALLAGRGQLAPEAAWATLIACGMLAPFILVNHSLRHQGPLVAMQAIVIGACAGAWIARRRRAPESAA